MIRRLALYGRIPYTDRMCGKGCLATLFLLTLAALGAWAGEGALSEEKGLEADWLKFAQKRYPSGAKPSPPATP